MSFLITCPAAFFVAKSMKQVLIINGHPDQASYNYALAKAYKQGAQSTTASIHQINLVELDFDPNLAFGYRKRTELESDLQDAIQHIKAADHLVWVFPMWWYGLHALMKGFIDRTFLPGITFQPIQGKALPKGLLSGKTSRIIITADTPAWYDKFFMRSPAIHQFKKGTLEFCGVKPVKVSYIAPIQDSTPTFRKKWLSKVSSLGKKLA